MYTLYAGKGCGSAVIEVALAMAGAPHTIVDADPTVAGDGADCLRPVNPLAQVPTLVMGDGTVLTESAAILVHLAEHYPEAGLAPQVATSARARHWRWLMFLSSNVYGPIGVGDHPEQWAASGDEAAHVERSIERIKAAWTILEANVVGPSLLGEEPYIVDVYAAMMSRWRPGRAWVDAHCPRLGHALQRAEALPIVAEVWARNFS